MDTQWFKIHGTSDNYYVFELIPGDLGRVKFQDTLLTPENGDLIMERHGRRLPYVKEMARRP
jgi:hypothetical protein